MKIEELRKQYEDNKYIELAETTKRNYNIYFNRLVSIWNKKNKARPFDTTSWPQVQALLKDVEDAVVKPLKVKGEYPPGYCMNYKLKNFVKTLYIWCGRTDIVHKMGKQKRLEPPEIQTLSYGQVKSLVKSIKDEQMRVLVWTLFCSGLRASEVISLKVKDITFDEDFGKVKSKGKRREKDTFYLFYDAIQHIESFVEGKEEDDYIFTRKDGNAFNYWQLWHEIKKLSEKFGQPFTPHTFRHSLAVHLVRKKIHIEQIRKILRHSDVRTTSIYLKSIGEQDVLEVINKLRRK